MATLKDIAQQVGVSVSAVSLALRDHPSIGQETRKRIWDVKIWTNAPDRVCGCRRTLV